MRLGELQGQVVQLLWASRGQRALLVIRRRLAFVMAFAIVLVPYCDDIVDVIDPDPGRYDEKSTGVFRQARHRCPAGRSVCMINLHRLAGQHSESMRAFESFLLVQVDIRSRELLDFSVRTINALRPSPKFIADTSPPALPLHPTNAGSEQSDREHHK